VSVRLPRRDLASSAAASAPRRSLVQRHERSIAAELSLAARVRTRAAT